MAPATSRDRNYKIGTCACALLLLISMLPF